MRRARLFLSLTTLLLASLANACLWDSDTLASEAAGKMEFVNVIVGRFERNPPLYYEMRLKRCAGEIAKGATDPGLFDDAAVACDRLGRDDDAIQWIERKRTVLPPLESATGETKDHWYRYEANVGTFWAHRFLLKGAKIERISELDTAIKHIEKAIEINPDAHFGREIVQLDVLRWIRKLKDPKSKWGEYDSKSLGEFLLDGENQDPKQVSKIIKGLAGLVSLGNAWESVDVFRALSNAFYMRDDGSLSQIANLRALEIEETGKLSLNKEPLDENRSEFEGSGMWPEPATEAFNDTEYKRLRKAANEWHERRSEFMLAKLKSGSHPDLDKTFWDEWKEDEPLEIKSPAIWNQRKFQMAAVGYGLGFVFCVLPSILSAWLIVHLIRAKRKNRQV